MYYITNNNTKNYGSFPTTSHNDKSVKRSGELFKNLPAEILARIYTYLPPEDVIITIPLISRNVYEKLLESIKNKDFLTEKDNPVRMLAEQRYNNRLARWQNERQERRLSIETYPYFRDCAVSGAAGSTLGAIVGLIMLFISIRSTSTCTSGENSCTELDKLIGDLFLLLVYGVMGLIPGALVGFGAGMGLSCLSSMAISMIKDFYNRIADTLDPEPQKSAILLALTEAEQQDSPNSVLFEELSSDNAEDEQSTMRP